MREETCSNGINKDEDVGQRVPEGRPAARLLAADLLRGAGRPGAEAPERDSGAVPLLHYEIHPSCVFKSRNLEVITLM